MGEKTGGEVDIRSRPFYLLLLMAGAVGALGALVTLAFFIAMRVGTQLLWDSLPPLLGLQSGTSSALFVVATCALGGLLVGLITRLTKSKPTLLAEELGDFADHGTLDPRRGAAGLLRGLIGLVFGGSIGPEGPLTGGTGGLGTWLARRRGARPEVGAVSTLAAMSGMFGAFLGSPFGFAMFAIETGLEEGKLSWKMLLPSIVAASVGYAVFFSLTGYVFGGMYEFPPYEDWHVYELALAVPLGLLGGLLGLLFIYLFRTLRKVAGRRASTSILPPTLAGLVLGVLGVAFPLLLFSGDAEVQMVIDQAAELGAATLITLAVLKVLVTALLLAWGWSGGYIFPSFFMGAALGLAVNALFPSVPAIVCMVCVMSGVAVALIKAPIALALIIGALFDVRLAPLIAVAILASFLLTYRIDLVPHAETAPDPTAPSRE